MIPDFSHPLYLLLFIPFFIGIWYWWKSASARVHGAVRISSVSLLPKRFSFRSRTYAFLPIVRFVACALLIIALAGPGKELDLTSINQQGIDIMVALDVSGSMRGEDFQPENRLAVAKKVMVDFISKRESDRIGFVVFAGDAYLQCPLTLEKDTLADIVNEINFNTVDEDGTAIGDALALSAARMVDSNAKSKVVLLITDGENNRGTIDPVTAAKSCAELGIKIYSVGIGKDGRVPVSGAGLFGGKGYTYNKFDEESIRKLSDITGGAFYRAESSGVLWEQVKEIDRLEKSNITSRRYNEFHTKYELYIIAAALLFVLELILRSAVYRKVP